MTSARPILASRHSQSLSMRRVLAHAVCALALFAATSAVAGTVGFTNLRAQVAGGTVKFFAGGIQNNSAFTSGVLRLELWASSAPPVPATIDGSIPTGFRLAQFTLGVLRSGAQLTNVESPSLPLGTPPDGVWYYIIYLTEFTGAAGNEGFTVDDWMIFLTGVTIGTPPPPPAPPATTVTAVEYYDADFGFYFVTAFPSEIESLDNGAFGGAWQRTGQSFEVWPQPNVASAATCRFFSGETFAPKSTHFYTPVDSECASLKANAAWVYEGIAFYIESMDVNGLCAAGTVPLYRLYNNSMGGAPNHRYTTSTAIFDAMIEEGWSFEGNGITKTFACVPG